MTNKFYFFRSFAPENGSGMDRLCIGTTTMKSRKLFSLLFVLILGIGQMWGATIPFTETFAECNSTGGNDNTWGNINTNVSISADNNGWSFTTGKAASKCARFGSSNSNGYATTPSITVTNGNSYVLTFKAAPWSSETATMTVTVTGGKIGNATSATTGNMSTSQWNSYEYTIVATANSMTIKFDASQNRFFLDEVSVTSAKSLSSIAHKTDATKTAYIVGETFAPAGLVITATYSDASTEDIAYNGNETEFSFSPNTSTALTTSNDKVTITYGGKSTDATHSQNINVYSVTVQVVDEDGNTLSGSGMPTASATGRNITASAKGNNYVFKTWEFVGSNNGLSFGTATNRETTLSGTPTGNVTIKAVYHKPIAVIWKVNGKAWTPSAKSGVDGTAEVGYGEQVSTLPTEPTTAEFCGQKFMGWTKTEIGSTGLTDASAISALNLFTTAGGSPQITTETTFHAVFADYGEE